MSIRARVEDAHIQYAIGRPEGALLSLLTAACATSRRRYEPEKPSVKRPGKKMGDGEAFEHFLHDEMPKMCRVTNYKVKYRGNMLPLEDIFWKWLRCELAHGAALPKDIRFVPDDRPGYMKQSIEPDGTLVLSHGWLNALSRVIVAAPENCDQFGDPPRAPLPIYLSKVGLTVNGPVPSETEDEGTGASQ